MQRLQCPANVRDRYIPYLTCRALRAEQTWEALGPVVQRFALAMAALKDRHPALKRTLKRVLRRSS